MQTKNLFIATTIIVFAISLSSCKKNKADATAELETTFALSSNQAVADNLTADANDILTQVCLDKSVMGNGFLPQSTTPNDLIPCAAVNISTGGFPKTITIDFGTTGICASPNGVIRKGLITINLSDSLRKPGSVATMNFSNYYINDYHKEGTITWTNITTTPSVPKWNRVVANGKITNPTGTYWLHTSNVVITQTAGAGTLILADDVHTISGTRTVTNSAGASRTSTTQTDLQKKFACDNIDKGILKVQGPNHYALIDFGDGTCDNQATISIDGGSPRSITLR